MLTTTVCYIQHQSSLFLFHCCIIMSTLCMCFILQPTKSVRFLTQPDSPTPRHRTTSLPSGSQPPASTRPGPPPLEVWAPSLTLGRDGPGIILKEGKAPVLRKGLETNPSDVLTSNQKPTSSLSSSAPSASMQSSSPSR
jgi:hypothetical protein